MAKDYIVQTNLPWVVKNALTKLSMASNKTQAEVVRALIVKELLEQGLMTNEQLLEELV